MDRVMQRCFTWPDCVCGRSLTNIDPRLDDWIANPLPREVILDNMLVIYCALRCVEAHSSRPSVRQSAAVQLLHPVWNALPRKFLR
jgi:hypothetical protein